MQKNAVKFSPIVGWAAVCNGYINASPDLQVVVDKVEKAGGKLLAPRVEIPAGFIAIIIDSEGNKVGLHAEK